MDSKHIHNLLEKYWSAETSLQEEKQLQNYFSGSRIDPKLENLRPLFQYCAQPTQEITDQVFEEKLLEKINAQSKPTAENKVFRMRSLMKIAAAFLLVFAVGWIIKISTEKTPPPQTAINWDKYECKNPEDCLKQLQSVLKLTSNQLNKGMEKAAEGMDKVEVATRVIK